ncbi:GntR family transcriptional regulator [Lachnoclostridium sp. An169]|uniref:GntR family transcriptional regulator n=1 Tax=Lachnoclostridium sp. An169 TaxID=1965569 RepID=UPI000B394037|nr:GntR family transcriptional regulator [Lachnoclostridium sp. An169]OUP86472.1 GntR family transcriptional regulator [Lachnoclostridium sp. An169]HJA64981.1 GntR family transcriptional regulator [Candidatus Mediterraneibacter cottocaccae]
MPWNLDDDRPIYLQLMERIQHDIISGVYKPGDKIPSVRDLALDAAVNPNTMQKALSELERAGLVYSQRTSGRFITEDEKMIKKMKMELASEHIRHFFDQMHHLGFSDGETLEMIQETIRGNNNATNT